VTLLSPFLTTPLSQTVILLFAFSLPVRRCSCKLPPPRRPPRPASLQTCRNNVPLGGFFFYPNNVFNSSRDPLAHSPVFCPAASSALPSRPFRLLLQRLSAKILHVCRATLLTARAPRRGFPVFHAIDVPNTIPDIFFLAFPVYSLTGTVFFFSFRCLKGMIRQQSDYAPLNVDGFFASS